jgi:hypothetical protein
VIYYICRESEQYTIAPFVYTNRTELEGRFSILTYEQLFADRSLEPGHLIFTDFDRMTVYEIETAQCIAMAMRQALPGVTILNEPAAVLQRFPYLMTLWRDGINPFRAARLDEGFPDLQYPVFIRREDEARGPETGLLHSPEELRAEIGRLAASGRPLRGRLAVEYCAERSPDGFFRKYGCFRVGDRILPQHIQFSDQWVVKQDSGQIGPGQLAEEMAYVRENPHEAEVMDAFERAHIGFGRMDYTRVGGRLVVYEINTNATFTRSGIADERQERRDIVLKRMLDALEVVDKPLPKVGRVNFVPPIPQIHALPGPTKPHKSAWTLLGKSSALDRAISLYWKVPKNLRQKVPDNFKMSLKHFLGQSLKRRYG